MSISDGEWIAYTAVNPDTGHPVVGVYSAFDGGSVADCTSEGRPLDECKRNAAVISAAPAMQVALLAAMAGSDGWRELAADAIAKAQAPVMRGIALAPHPAPDAGLTGPPVVTLELGACRPLL